MTTFVKGQAVKAKISTQGLTQGNTYYVIDVNEKQMPWGNFVTYVLTHGDAGKTGLLAVNNGHLLLEAVA